MSIKFIILGCGSSMGVPRADGYWGKCDPKEKKNYRTRCSALISTKNTNTLIDTSPDLRAQLLNNKIKNIKRIFFSHMHADQTHGINELRIFYLKNKEKLKVYADELTSNFLKKNFSYCFKSTYGYPAILKLEKIKKNLVFRDKKQILNIKSIPVKHGKIDCLSFIINNKLAYASDINYIYKKDLKFFLKLKYFIVDCLRINEHPSHFNLNDVLKLINIIKPKKTILTNLQADFDYKSLKKKLPNNVVPAYDGMSLNI